MSLREKKPKHNKLSLHHNAFTSTKDFVKYFCIWSLTYSINLCGFINCYRMGPICLQWNAILCVTKMQRNNTLYSLIWSFQWWAIFRVCLTQKMASDTKELEKWHSIFFNPLNPKSSNNSRKVKFFFLNVEVIESSDEIK